MPKPSNLARRRGRPQQAPDYAARRMLASALAITVVVVASVVVWRAFGGDTTTLAAADGTWNRIGLVNRTRGTITTVDTSGATIAEFAGFSRLLDVHTEGDRVALIGPQDIYLGSFDPDATDASGSGTAATPAASASPSTQASTTVDPPTSVPTTTLTTTLTTDAATSETTLEATGTPAGSSPGSSPGTSPVPSTIAPPTQAVTLPPGFVSVPYERSSTVTRLAIADRLVLAVGQPLGGNAMLIDAQSGQMVDIGELADLTRPLLFLDTIQFDHTGTYFAIADAANFQTIVVTLSAEPTVEFFPDAPLAVSDELVVTSQVVGQRADVAFFRHDGTTLRSISMAIPAGAVLTERGLIVVTNDGTISRVAGDLSTATSLGSIERPDDGTVVGIDPVGSGARLVVSGDTFQTVIDLDGVTIGSAEFDGSGAVVEPQPAWTCLPIGSADSIESLISLDDGAVLGGVRALELIGTSADGCTLLGQIDSAAGVADTIIFGSDVAEGSSIVSLGANRDAVISPDGAAAIRVTRDSTVELVGLEDQALTDPIDLTDLTQPTALTVVFFNQ